MTLLTLKNISKSFDGVLALNDVSFDVKANSIVGIIGPNGAGKTTIFNLITGNYKPNHGDIIFDDCSILNIPTHKLVSSGIARTFQTIRLFQNLTVIENVLGGCHCQMKSGPIAAMLRSRRQIKEEKEAIAVALDELNFIDLRNQASKLAKNLPYGKQRLLEIARALATRPRLLILDEPAGGMNEQETIELITLIENIRKKGITILLIEHDMNFVMNICEHIVVLEYGNKIAEGNSEEIMNHPKVIEAYLGIDEV